MTTASALREETFPKRSTTLPPSSFTLNFTSEEQSNSHSDPNPTALSIIDHIDRVAVVEVILSEVKQRLRDEQVCFIANALLPES
jgi:hypothetical protein